MRSLTEIGPSITPSGVRALEGALRSVLGERVEEELRALFENEPWYRNDLTSAELFDLWVIDAVERPDDPQWVLQFLRVSERKFLCDALGIARARIIGLPPRDLGLLVLQTLGLPFAVLSGFDYYRKSWLSIARMVERNEDATAATHCRQLSERFLKQLLSFYCSGEHRSFLLQVLREPGELRLPPKLQRFIRKEDGGNGGLSELLASDDWADLGFLALCLAKMASLMVAAGIRHIRGGPLILLDSRETQAFVNLGTALQAYAHDKPSRIANRRAELLLAVRSVIEATETMGVRGTVPEELVVCEHGTDVVGTWFAGRSQSGGKRLLRSSKLPALGARVLFLASSDRNPSHCQWAYSPWPAL